MNATRRFPAMVHLAIPMFCLLGALAGRAQAAADGADPILQRLGVQRGVCAVLGLPDGGVDQLLELVRGSEITVYFQSGDPREVEDVRLRSAAAGLLGARLFVDLGELRHIHLADNLADAVIVSAGSGAAVDERELLRVLCPRGKALWAGREIVKPVPEGVDSWSHPFHGPDNNPQSTDQLARAPYLTQFLANPLFVPMPEISVAAGGRVFRAFGHIAHKSNQNAMLNTLICASVYNGTVLWQRPLPEGFMIHRNTMVATDDCLYLADHRSCKVIDAASGEVREEIVVPEGISDGPVWKWMAIRDGVLYALVGGEEIAISTQPSQVRGLGHWPWGMWPGHDYSDPKNSFGFGRTFIALDLSSKKLLWSHREKEYLDARGVCLSDGRIFYTCPEKFIGCLDLQHGRNVWKNQDSDLLEAIGPNGPAQHYVTGYATTAYIKSHKNYLFFAGPQRSRLVVASADDGRLLWTKEHGNFLLVLREDGVYAAGPQQPGPADTLNGYRFAYEDGRVLDQLPMRRACTRATGSVDSIFYRANEGTMRIQTADRSVHHIAPMRPPCQDGVIISDGMLLWGPWMCGCQLSLYGHIGLTAAGSFNFRPGLDESRLERLSDASEVSPLPINDGDWPAHQRDNARSSVTSAEIPGRVVPQWTFQVPASGFPTAPVTAGGFVFLGDRNGRVYAVSADSGELRWQAFTGGAIYVAPAIAEGRLFVGSADGRVYAFEAATGRPLWRFRAAPADRWIPVYGQLMSTWPVSGGVVVDKGTVYAAAGIAHYDGTHVYALDAATGQVKWYNDSSGTTSPEMDHGVSLQGELSIRDGELRFLAGSVHEEARYDLATGKCLNEPVRVPSSGYHTAFYGYFPDYGKYTSLDCALADGRSLCYDVSYEGSWQSSLRLVPSGVAAERKPLSRWGLQFRRGKEPASIWEQKQTQWYNAFIVAQATVVAAGHAEPLESATSFLKAFHVADGRTLWQHELSGKVVKGGAATNHARQFFVALEDGKLLAFAAQ